MNTIYTSKDLKGLASKIGPGHRVFVIIDNNLKQYYRYFENYHMLEIETSEIKKTMETVSCIYSRLLNEGADRNSFILGVGGGITTDIAGFVASTYKRGVKFAFVPTTLLAQADASIGGKNGVNFQSYKNMIGTITQPEWIYECPEVLQTLTPREFRAGIAEMLKTFILFDGAAYSQAAAYFSELNDLLKKQGSCIYNGEFYKNDILEKLLGLCAGYKGRIVEKDPNEKGERRLLNLGHTFGHAIEKIFGDAGKDIMHGEAVSIGIILAAKVAASLGRTKESFVIRLKEDFEAAGLPSELPPDPVSGKKLMLSGLMEAIKKDKKIDGDFIHFILPEDAGRAEDIKLELKKLESIANDLC
ncbi:MAG: 3-dehydroquinate synthase [Bacteroidales bacterium]|nr:3-dehydroquinate synthase [Bacteroidales bacterium]